MSGLTPMMQQYQNLKMQYPDCLLMFRLGDFYELFFKDAETASRELDIVLTGREGGLEERIPMCGVPHHALDNYLARLLEKGYRVAIADQMEDPAQARGLVDRQVTRVITPGTITDDSLLPADSPNYLACLVEDEEGIGLAYLDVSSGEFAVMAWRGSEAGEGALNELFRLSPAEILIPPEVEVMETVARYLQACPGVVLTRGDNTWFVYTMARERLQGQWRDEDLNLEQLPIWGATAAGAVLYYLDRTQRRSLSHLHPPQLQQENDFVSIDVMTRKNLELVQNLRDQGREGTLFQVLDFCLTSGGKRTLRSWIEQPLVQVKRIEQRLDAVQELLETQQLREELDRLLDLTYDLERITARLGGQTASPRDLGAIRATLRVLPAILALGERVQTPYLKGLLDFDPMSDLALLLERALAEELPVSPLQGWLIKPGYDAEVDELRELTTDGSQWLLEYERKERERSGIKSLKVGYNKVFGYYIEITRANLSTIPDDYIRKQTLVNAERFITEELKDYENRILGAREKLEKLEYELFNRLRQQVANYIQPMQKAAWCLGQLDSLSSLAKAAFYHNYVRPAVSNDRRTVIKGGRHPVVEKNLRGERFIPNDCELDASDYLAIITGPNMGGKSTFMRQVALIHIMAQAGGFVPADEAALGVVDKVFARVGASDDLASGRSTFMVEMAEVATILQQATPRSLILLDEIGRGTSTYDGMSIARAVVEEIAGQVKARTLFATHYHELTSLEELEGVFNLFVSVVEQGDRVIFLRKVLPGKADRSYGIQVAQLAGIPPRVVERARVILKGLENNREQRSAPRVEQPSLFDDIHPVVQKIRELDPDQVKPLEALQYLYEWKKMV